MDLCSLESWLGWDDRINAPMHKWRHLENDHVGMFNLTFKANVQPDSKSARLASRVQAIMQADIFHMIQIMVVTMVVNSMPNCPEGTVSCGNAFLDTSAVAYGNACELVLYQFFHEMFEENELIHLALLNEMVSGYHLDREKAWLVRKPTLLERDAQGRLHSASGPCIQYRDGLGAYAWHGVHVSERLIMHPEQITRQEWVQERNAEVRRAIQERLGTERFIELVGGKQIDAGSRGKLIEIDLGSGSRERRAHYVQVQDSSTERQYYLRVPPSITRADEAVAWTFGFTEAEYQPRQET